MCELTRMISIWMAIARGLYKFAPSLIAACAYSIRAIGLFVREKIPAPAGFTSS